MVFADISGFSRLTRLYHRKGDEGVEALSRIISDYLGKAIDRVFTWGGDIENLYGDALLAFWPETSQGLKVSAERAVACASAIVGDLDNYLSGGTVLRIRAAVVAGDLHAVRIGTETGQWHFMLTGPSFDDLPRMLQRARSGEICTSDAIRAVAPNIPERAVAGEFRAGITARPPIPSAQVIPDEMDRTFLSMFMPAWIRRRDLLNPEWLAEFRQIAMVCIGITGLRCSGPDDLTPILNALVTMQERADRFDGALIRMSMSDKGPMAMIVFGLPDQAHDDDPIRAVRVAQEISIALGDKGTPARCAVTFGPAYCGLIGNEERYAPGIIGDVTNRAAKSLELEGLPPVVCDEAIVQRAGQRVDFASVERTFADGSAMFCPLHYQPAPAGTTQTLSGREQELNWLLDYLQRASRGEPVPVLYVDGEPGIGKSTLMAEFGRIARSRQRLLHGGADPLAGTISPFAAWIPVFADALAADIADGPEQCHVRLREALVRQQVPPDYAGLATVVLPGIGLPGAAPVDLPPDDRARVTADTLTVLLRDSLRADTCAIVLDDVQWMDASSWRLATQVAREVPGVLMVLVARPEMNGPWPGMRELADAVAVERLRLGPLGITATAAVVADAVDCEATAPSLAEIIQQRADGNPLFARQLALSLRDQGALNLRDGICRLASHAVGTIASQLPESIQRTMVARVDRLPVDLQTTLKAASVVGSSFSDRALVAAMATPAVDATGMLINEIPDRLNRLAEAGMISIVHDGRDLLYRFEHALIQDAVYRLLPFEQRRRLHVATVGHYESEPPVRRPSPAILGLHWSRADRPDRALPYWEHAGMSALSGGAYREAVMALQEAISAVQQIHASPGSDVAKPSAQIGAELTGRLHHHLGWALLQSGDFRLSEQHLVSALTQFGFHWPQTAVGTTWTLMRHVMLQTVTELLRASGATAARMPAAFSSPGSDRIRQSALTLETLGQTFGHRSKFAAMMTATLAALNLSHRAGDAALYSRSAGLLALVLMVGELPTLSRYYLARARRTIPDETSPHDRLMTSEYIAMYLLAAGLLREAETELRWMLDLASRHNNRRRHLDATSLLILTLLELGDTDACASLIHHFESAAERSGDVQLRCWSHLEAADLAFRLGNVETARRRLTDVTDLLATQGSNERIWTLGLLAAVELRQSRIDSAMAHAREVLAMLVDWRIIGFYAQAGVFGAAEVFLSQLRNGAGRLSRGERAEAERMIRLAARFGMRQPLTQPRALLLLADHAALRGHTSKASRLTKRATAVAVRQQRPVPMEAMRVGSAALKNSGDLAA
ncbi:MAG: AAA family ATPase [Proteobacteria bacterium]|nr:AAA family ATPase [Pseudomonadota bacterium]